LKQNEQEENHLEPKLDRFSLWDRIWANQCEIRRNGRDLSANNYALFKKLNCKMKTINHLLTFAPQTITIVSFRWSTMGKLM
jgi:hypothetical protein